MDSKHTNLPNHNQQQLQIEYSEIEKQQIKRKSIQTYKRQLSQEYEIVKIQQIIQCIEIIISEQKQQIMMKFEKSGIIPDLIDLARKQISPQLTKQITHILTNIALIYETQTQIIVENGGIQLFAALLESKHEKIVNDALYGLQTISVHSTVYRDMILCSEVLQTILKAKISSIQRKITCLSQLCRGDPLPTLEKIRSCIDYFCKAILNESDSNSYIFGLWALSQIEERSEEQRELIKLIRGYNILNRLIYLIDHEMLLIKLQTLRIIEKIVKGGAFYIDQVIQTGFLIKVPGLFQHPDNIVTEFTFRVLSIIVTGSQQQLKLVLEDQQIFEHLLITAGSKNLDAGRELAKLLSNSLSTSDIQIVEYLMKRGLFRIYKQLLECQRDQCLLLIVIEGLTKFLEKRQQIEENSYNTIYLLELNQFGLDKLIYNQVQLFKTEYVMKIYNKFANLL